MAPLDRKLLRDLWRLRGQVLAVALVVASGVALLVMSLTTLSALRATGDTYYERQHFADIFADLERAPEALSDRIRALAGVQTVETRAVGWATVEVATLAEPIVARLLSLPDRAPALLNRVVLRAGRLPRAGHADEAVVHQPFAEAHGLRLGDRVRVLMNGAKREVRVTGIALSPEYIYAIAPGGLVPDDARFAVIWMSRSALDAAYDLDGAFNDISLALTHGTPARAVIPALDTLLQPYGGLGAIARADQVSNWFLQNEFEQLRTLATIMPAIFLSVAAFLTQTVIGRLVTTERQDISLMKAFGYTDLQIGWHYAKLAMAIAGVGLLLGWLIGAYLGIYQTRLYGEVFRFPFLHFRPDPTAFAVSAAVALGTALLGALWSVRQVARLHPAEAMRPPAPQNFRSADLPGWLARGLDQPTRIILRQIVRSPVRSALTTTGCALAVATLILALHWEPAIKHLAFSYFDHTQHQDVTIGFQDTIDTSALPAIGRLPGVRAVEPMRIVAAEVQVGASRHRGTVTGLAPDPRLQVIDDIRGWRIPVPEGGIVIASYLAEQLGVRAGDTVRIQLLEGRRPVIDARIVGLQDTLIDTPIHMGLDALNRALDEPGVVTFATVLVDPARETALYARLQDIPAVATVTVDKTARDTFLATIGGTILVFVGFFTGFSAALTIGVMYNATRIALSERGRELATLRVLGFTRWEVSYILLGEAALLLLLALPLGSAAGFGLVWVMSLGFETELYRVPLVIPPSALGWSAIVAVLAGTAAAGLVRRRLDRLDLIAVLKTRE